MQNSLQLSQLSHMYVHRNAEALHRMHTHYGAPGVAQLPPLWSIVATRIT